ncbi:hypothetical protein PIB30_035635 [Stylosanthes scabra]|uniref:Uncharacterized protein n=1 Tax=Stylosanthes scabra TaxID=79078 RepID=A0ABU6ZC62_9FABA|nr:hypothetical protein [Stylosanthes scabra]
MERIRSLNTTQHSAEPVSASPVPSSCVPVPSSRQSLCRSASVPVSHSRLSLCRSASMSLPSGSSGSLTQNPAGAVPQRSTPEQQPPPESSCPWSPQASHQPVSSLLP